MNGEYNADMAAVTPLLACIADRPDDDALWLLLAQQLAEADHIDEARWLRRDYGMVRRLLVMGWPEIAAVREDARKVSPYALELVDALIPLMRRKVVQQVRSLADRIPPLPKDR